MSAIDRVLEVLQKEQVEYAVGKLKKAAPASPSFEYGQASGYIQGLEKAIETILETIQEPADNEPNSPSTFEQNLRGTRGQNS